MAPSGLPVPRLLGHTRMGRFVSPSGDGPSALTVADLADTVGGLIRESSTDSMFARPVSANKGAGAQRLDADTLDEAAAERLFEAVQRDDYLFQESVRQHARRDALGPDSPNTPRVLVGQGERRSADFPGHRPDGEGGSGGRQRACRRHVHGRGPRQRARHPDIGTPFEGFGIPQFAQAIDLAQRTHAWLPHPYAGWDTGMSADGPIAIEANPGPYLLTMDVAHGGLKAYPAVRAFLDDHGVAYRF